MAKSKGKDGVKAVCTNKKARRDYHIEDTIEAGLVLWGNEVKSLREGRANLGDAYAGFSNGEVWHSLDYGDTWRQLNVSLGRIQRALLLVP